MEIEPTLTPNINFSDSIIREQGSGKLTLVGTFQRFNVQQFPFQPAPFFVTVALANLRGKLQGFKMSVRLQHKSSGHVIFSPSSSFINLEQLQIGPRLEQVGSSAVPETHPPALEISPTARLEFFYGKEGDLVGWRRYKTKLLKELDVEPFGTSFDTS